MYGHSHTSSDLIEMYKILNRYYNIDPSKFFNLSTTFDTRDHQCKLFKHRSRLLVRHNYFSNRAVNLWNSLPEPIISAPTVAVFQQRLGILWDMGTIKGLWSIPSNFDTAGTFSLLNNYITKYKDNNNKAILMV